MIFVCRKWLLFYEKIKPAIQIAFFEITTGIYNISILPIQKKNTTVYGLSTECVYAHAFQINWKSQKRGTSHISRPRMVTRAQMICITRGGQPNYNWSLATRRVISELFHSMRSVWEPIMLSTEVNLNAATIPIGHMTSQWRRTDVDETWWCQYDFMWLLRESQKKFNNSKWNNIYFQYIQLVYVR